MATKIAEIKNLTNNTVIENSELAKFDNQTTFSGIITNTSAAVANWNDFDENDNIQVIWKNTAGNKVICRAVGGKITKDGTKVTISGLMNVSEYSVGINGQLGIGPAANPEAVLLSVRIGNLNPPKDWIIDFSDTEDGAPGSSIKLKELVGWIQGKTGDNNPDSIKYPDIEGDKDASDFLIEFKDFYFNITQKTFDFNVESKDGDEIIFGDFTIKKVGFRVTNTPVTVGAIEA